MNRPHPRIAWLVLAPLLAAGACGSPAPPLPKVDACVLFVEKDAEEIAGMPMVAAFGAAPRPDAGECIYSSREKSTPRRLGLVVEVFESPEQAAKIFEATASQLAGFSGQPPRPISGVADRALWSGGQLNKLYVLRGRHRLIIGAMATDDASSLAAAKEVATRALARLPG